MSDTAPQSLDASPPAHLTLSERELFERLGWFTHVRWGAGLMAMAFLGIGHTLFDVRFALRPAIAAIGVLLAYNTVFSVWARWLYRRRRIRRRWILSLAHAQITCDLLAVAALVHFIGGVENHFIILFVFPMIVASEFFAPKIAFGYATLAAVLINLIGWGEYFYPAIHTTLSVCEGGEAAEVCVPLVGAHVAQHWIFVSQVTFAMTFAVYVTVFVAGSIASRLRAREHDLEAAYDDLRSLEQVKSQFMRKTSHELRAPVGAVQSLLKTALLKMPEDTEGRGLLVRAVGRSESMLDLIDDLLRYSRLRRAAAVERLEPLELAEVVRAAADLFRAQAQEKGITLDVRAESAVVNGSRESLTDLVNNLVSNAVRYTPEGGRVSVGLESAGSRVQLAVADTGIGIPADELPRVFEEFFRGKEAKRTVQHGTGLGMAIIKRVVAMHGGTIGVESEVGQGTTFSVTFPSTDANG